MRRIVRIAAPLVAVALTALSAGIRAGDPPKRCTQPVQECLDHMSALLKTSGWVGIEYDDVSEGGFKVTRVVPDSPAEKAGLQPGDLLVALNGVRLAKDNEMALSKARKEWKPGQSVTYSIRRQGQNRDITLTLAPMPADVMARWIGEHMMLHVGGSAPAATK